MVSLLPKEYPKTLHLNNTISKQGIYKGYQYFTTLPYVIKVHNQKKLFDKYGEKGNEYGDKGYVIIRPNQQGYSCKTNELEQSNFITKITFDKKDTHDNRVIGFNTYNTKYDKLHYLDPTFTKWVPKKVIKQCTFIIDVLSNYDTKDLSAEIVNLLHLLGENMYVSDLAISGFKRIAVILKTQKSHEAVKAIEQAKTKSTSNDIKKAYKLLNQALCQAHIDIFNTVYNFYNQDN